MNRSTVLMAVLGAALLLAGAADAASSRGVPLKLRASEKADAPVVEEVQLYGNSHALVIGIDDYTNGWPRLSMAVKDAQLVAAALKKKGFDVTLVLNAKAVELNRAFEEFFLLKGEDPDARLFVWYAGHGHSERGEGFLVPADAPTPAKRGQFRLKSLALRRVGEFVRLAESKHAFAIFDSCFSGTVFESARALPPSAVTRATTLPVRQFLTSGDAGQTVSDDGTFRELFIRALDGEERADANGDGYVTASEMGLFLTDRVTNLTQSKQTPRYGKLRDKDWDRGDFVFSLPEVEKPKPKQVATATRAADTGAAAARLQQETVFWESIKDSGDPSAYKAYLEAFPGGTFAPLARVKLKAAEGKAITQQRALADERKALEAERQRLAAEAEARRKAEDEARRKAFAEERAKLAAERERFAAEAEARRKAEDEARQKRLAEERARLAKQQQIAALTPKSTPAASPTKTRAPTVIALAPAAYLPLPEGTKVDYGTWSFKVGEVEGTSIIFRDSNNKYRAYEMGFIPTGESPFTIQIGKNGGATDPVLSFSSEAKASFASLWPLEVGKSATFTFEEQGFGGSYAYSYEDEWTYKVKVTGTEQLAAAGKHLGTYVIEIAAHSDNGRKFDEKLWYHPASGLIVKKKRSWSGTALDSERGHRISLANTDPGETQSYELKHVRFPEGSKNALAE